MKTGYKTIEDYLKLTVTDCKRCGFFVPNATATGVMTWNANGKKIAEIGFGTNLKGIPFAVLSYSYKGEPIETKIQLRFYHSNLKANDPDTTKGYYYFVCPETGRSCRNLYLVNGRFVSRHALRAHYAKQYESHKQRSGLVALLSTLDKIDRLTAQKYRRYTYRGKLTPYGRKIERLNDKWAALDNVRGRWLR